MKKKSITQVYSWLVLSLCFLVLIVSIYVVLQRRSQSHTSIRQYSETLTDVGFDTFVTYTETTDEETFQTHLDYIKQQFSHYNELFDYYHTYDDLNNLKSSLNHFFLASKMDPDDPAPYYGLMLVYSGAGFVFGWAKPVPVNFAKLKNYRRDIVIVASAGIVTNFILAAAAALLLAPAKAISHPEILLACNVFLVNMIVFNIALAVFNLLPIPPLDGSKMLFGWIEQPWAQKYIAADRWGFIAIISLAIILPEIGRFFDVNWNFFALYMIKASKLFISLFL